MLRLGKCGVQGLVAGGYSDFGGGGKAYFFGWGLSLVSDHLLNLPSLSHEVNRLVGTGLLTKYERLESNGLCVPRKV